VKQVAVIGLGQFGTHVARTLVKMGCEVLVLDMDDERVAAVTDDVHRAIIGDARDLKTLEAVLNDAIDEAIVALGESNIEPSILCVLHLRKIGVPHIRSTARNDDHAMILRAVGAAEVIFPERDTAERIARLVANPDLRDMFPLSGDYRIIELVAPKKLVGHPLADVNLRKEYDLLILAVRDPGQQEFRYLPRADTVIHDGEVLMVLGRELDLARFASMG
jgi:trk system potassium uptake protein TrkA